MSRYEVKFVDDGDREPGTLQFEAEDVGVALILAHQQAPDRSAELWQDDRKLCTIKRKPPGEVEVRIVGGWY